MQWCGGGACAKRRLPVRRLAQTPLQRRESWERTSSNLLLCSAIRCWELSVERWTFASCLLPLLLLWFWNRSDPYPREVLVGLQQIVASALENLEQIIHRRNFLELLGQEPLQEIDRDVVVLLPREFDEPVDLLGDMNFLIERKLHRVPRGLEFRFRRIDRRDHHAPAGVDNVFDKAERVPFLFLRLAEKML